MTTKKVTKATKGETNITAKPGNELAELLETWEACGIRFEPNPEWRKRKPARPKKTPKGRLTVGKLLSILDGVERAAEVRVDVLLCPADVPGENEECDYIQAVDDAGDRVRLHVDVSIGNDPGVGRYKTAGELRFMLQLLGPGCRRKKVVVAMRDDLFTADAGTAYVLSEAPVLEVNLKTDGGLHLHCALPAWANDVSDDWTPHERP